MAKARFLRVVEVAHSAELGRSPHPLNMQNVLSAFRDGSHSLVFFVGGQDSRTNLYLGLYKSGPASHVFTADHIGISACALHGNYPGIRLSALGPREMSTELLRPIASQRYVGAVTGIPSVKEGGHDVFVQGLERLTNSLRGADYSLVVVAEPISEAAVDDVIQRCRSLGSGIHAFVRGTLTDSSGHTVSRADQKAGSISGGLIVGATSLLGGTLGFGPLMSMAMLALQGVLGMAGFSMGRTDTSSETRTLGSSREALNKTAEFCEQLLDRYISLLYRTAKASACGTSASSSWPTTRTHCTGARGSPEPFSRARAPTSSPCAPTTCRRTTPSCAMA